VNRIDPLLVGAGGFAGACARHLLSLAVAGPTGTLVVNALGSLALGVLVAAAPGRRTRLVLGTGLCSSLTTYSTFAVETTALGGVGAVANVALTHGLGVGAALAGLAIGDRLAARRRTR
jgi:CrcB protein